MYKRILSCVLVTLGLMMLWRGGLVAAPSEPPVDEFLRLEQMARAARDVVSHHSAPIRATITPLPGEAWRIGITTDGLYQVTYASLLAAGVPVTGLRPADVHILWRGQPVAVQVFNAGAATLDAGDALRFYAQAFHGSRQDEKYTDENVYWLVIDTQHAHTTMAARNVAPIADAPLAPGCWATVKAERNRVYWARWSQTPGTDATWFWERINTSSTLTRTYPITVGQPLADGQAAQLVVELAAQNEQLDVAPDHHLRVLFNDAPVGETMWDGLRGHIFTTTVSAAALKSGQNAIQVVYLTDVGHQTVYFDRATLRYQRAAQLIEGGLVCEVPLSGTQHYTLTGISGAVQVYDISAPLTPVILQQATRSGDWLAFQDTLATGDVFLAATTPHLVTPTYTTPPQDLITPTVGADWLVIAPRAFHTALQPLLAHRRTQGWRVRWVAVEDVYPLFKGGVLHPEALRALVAHAYHTWPGPPLQALFLVGDGTFNLKGYHPATYGAPVPTHIPPYLAFEDPTQGDVPVDAWFGDVTGDGLPEVSVGRLPAETVAEVEGYVAKVLRYETQVAAPWQLQTVWVADDGQNASFGDEGFSRWTDRVMATLPSDLPTQTVYMNEYCSGPDRPSTQACPSMTHALTTAWQAGAGWLTYIGHGAIHRWGHEKFLLTTQLADFAPSHKLPILLALDCWDGYWMFPQDYPASGIASFRSMGEWATAQMTHSGSVAAIGPAGLGFATQEELFAQALYHGVYEEATFALGALMRLGRQAISESYLARTYTLLGDPLVQYPGWERFDLARESVALSPGTSGALDALFPAQGRTRWGTTHTVAPQWTDARGVAIPSRALTLPIQAGAVVSVTAHVGMMTATATLAVIPGQPVSLTVTPQALVLRPQEVMTFATMITDRWGNATAPTATVTWASSAGVIDDAGHFSAPRDVGQVVITATAQAGAWRAVRSVPVTVVHDRPVTVSITPTALAVQVDDYAPLSVEVYDQWGNPVALQPEVAWEATAGAVSAAGMYHAPIFPAMGMISAAVRFQGGTLLMALTDAIPVTVTVGPATDFLVQPNAVHLPIEAQQRMHVTPIDAFANPAPFTGTVVWDSSVGQINAAGLFTAPAEAAQGWITATVDFGGVRVTHTAPVTIVYAEPVGAVITPSRVETVVGASTAISVALVDDSGRSVPLPVTVQWHTSRGTIVGAEPQAQFTAPSAPGAGHISATVAFTWGTLRLALDDRVPVTVHVGPPTYLHIVPPQLRIAGGAHQTLTTTARDAYANPTPFTGTVTWAASLGSIQPVQARVGHLVTFTAPLYTATGWITATAQVVQQQAARVLWGRITVEVAGHSEPPVVFPTLYLPLVMRKL